MSKHKRKPRKRKTKSKERASSDKSSDRKSNLRVVWIPILILVAVAALVILYLTTGWRSTEGNVLFITLDTVRADRLSCYGYRGIQTPNIDFVAENGVLFENAIASAPLTLPSHTTLLTGLYPNVHGVRDNSTNRLSHKAVTLAEIMRSHGYETGAVVGSFILDSDLGLDQGFGYYDDEMVSSPVTSGSPSRGGNSPTLKRLSPRPASAVTARAVSWLRKNRDKKFFLWVHYYDAHYPYTPPSPYSVQYQNNPYDGEIAFVDENIRSILDELEKRNLYDRTLILVAGDHGESLGEHGEKTHGVFTYESTIRIPFILRYPPVLPGGKRVEAPVTLADVIPTVLDILGIVSPTDFSGVSLMDVIQENREEHRYVYSESMFSYFTYGWSPIECIRDSRWKYIRSTEPELYDLSVDPSEVNNLIETKKEVAAGLEEKLNDLTAANYTGNLNFAEGRNVSAEERERLNALGYVSGGSVSEEEASLRDPKEMIRFHILIDEGNKALDAGRREEAFENFRTVIDLASAYDSDPQIRTMMGMVHNRLGLIYINRNDIDKAGIEFQKAIDSDPELLDAYHNMGNIHRTNKNYPAAIACYRKAIEIDPSALQYYITLAKIYTQMGDTLNADQAYRRAVELGYPRR